MLFYFGAHAVAAEFAAGGNDAMAGKQEGEWVGTEGGADGAGRLRAADFTGEIPVRDRFSPWNMF